MSKTITCSDCGSKMFETPQTFSTQEIKNGLLKVLLVINVPTYGCCNLQCTNEGYSSDVSQILTVITEEFNIFTGRIMFVDYSKIININNILLKIQLFPSLHCTFHQQSISLL